MNIAVLGATGRTGTRIVAEPRGHAVRPRTGWGRTVQGSSTDLAARDPLLKGAEFVVSAA